MRWHTGASDALLIDRYGPGKTSPEVLAIVNRYGATHTSEQPVEILNAAGLTTGKGKPSTKGGVALIRDAYKIWAPRTVGVNNDEVSVKQAAAELSLAPAPPPRRQRSPWPSNPPAIS